jgi:hypothetical protein
VLLATVFMSTYHVPELPFLVSDTLIKTGLRSSIQFVYVDYCSILEIIASQ